MTPGRRALLAVLLRTQARYVAARCRVTTSAVYGWRSGRRSPSAASRRELERSYGIPRSVWTEGNYRHRAR